MTTVTTDTVTRRPAARRVWPSVGSFLAGATLASAVAVGVHVAADDGTAPAPAIAASNPAVAVEPSPDGGCLIVQGRC